MASRERMIDMALTRKFLKALGIEDDKVDEIITAHSDTVNALEDGRADADKLGVHHSLTLPTPL